MGPEPFSQRVRNLRDAWTERRQVQCMAGAHDLESQFSLLLTLHSWALEAAMEIDRVYAGAVAVAVSDPPTAAIAGASFSVFVGNDHTLAFVLDERQRAGAARWSVSVSVGSAEGGAVAAGPERRNGHWTRARLEELLLTILGAWERAQSDGGHVPTGR